MQHEDASGKKILHEGSLDDIQRDWADDISNLWQISIHNISSLFLRRKRLQRITEPYKNSLWIANEKKTRWKRMLQLLEMHADWLSNRGLCWKQNTATTNENARPKESASFLNALLIYLPQRRKREPLRLYGIETLQNKAIRYLFNLIHNSSSTPSPYNVRGKQIKMKWKRWVCAILQNITGFISSLWMMIWCWFNLSNANFIQYSFFAIIPLQTFMI